MALLSNLSAKYRANEEQYEQQKTIAQELEKSRRGLILELE